MNNPKQTPPKKRCSLKTWLTLALYVTLCTTCTSVSNNCTESINSKQNKETVVRNAVVKSGLTLLGQKPSARVTVRGREFVLDCIGTVSAAWWGAGYDIQLDFPKYKGNGVLRLYKSLDDWDALHIQKEPKAGDIIFWENTYDRNGDGILYNDGITHAGLVVLVEDDGTVHYLHTSYSRGVVIAFCNLRHPKDPMSPEGKIWNSPMYLGSNYTQKNNPPYWLSGDLWLAFGDAAKTAATLDSPEGF